MIPAPTTSFPPSEWIYALVFIIPVFVPIPNQLCQREMYVNNKRVKIQVWDTGGQQRYRPVLASCYRGALGVIIVFDVTNMISFKNIKQWLVEVEEFSTDSTIPRMLVGNKADLSDRREVGANVAEEFARQHNITYIETSVIGKENIKEAFLELVKSGIRQ